MNHFPSAGNSAKRVLHRSFWKPKQHKWLKVFSDERGFTSLAGNEVWLWEQEHLEASSALELLQIPHIGFIMRSHLCLCSSNPASFWFWSVAIHQRVISNYRSKINNSWRFPDPSAYSPCEIGLCWWSQNYKLLHLLNIILPFTLGLQPIFPHGFIKSLIHLEFLYMIEDRKLNYFFSIH